LSNTVELHKRMLSMTALPKSPTYIHILNSLNHWNLWSIKSHIRKSQTTGASWCKFHSWNYTLINSSWIYLPTQILHLVQSLYNSCIG